MNRHSVASAEVLFGYYFDGIDACNVLYGLLNCHPFDVVFKKSFSLIEHLCEVEFFKHLRLCDEVSYPVNRHSVASDWFYWCITLIQ